MYYEELTSIKFNTTKNTNIIILKYHNLDFNSASKSYNLKIFNKKIIDYVKDATKNYKTKAINAIPSVDVITTILPHLTSTSTYTAVLYCDTPLITEKVINEAIEFAVFKNLDVCKLPRGYVFKNKFLLSKYASENAKSNQLKTKFNAMHSTIIYEPMIQSFNFFEELFMPVINFIEFEKVNKIMQQKINEQFQLKGVNILNSPSVHIDPTVTFGKNVTIYPNNRICSGSKIKNNVTLWENNVIENTIIENNCNIYCSVLKNCVVKKNVSIAPFSNFKDLTIS